MLLLAVTSLFAKEHKDAAVYETKKNFGGKDREYFVMSFKKVPLGPQDAYDVPDNRRHSKEYYNAPLDEFYNGIKNAVKNGYSVVIAGDVSEPGKWGWKDIGVVPTFDIPRAYSNQDAREFRFYNRIKMP